MGWQGTAAPVGVAQYKPEKHATAPRMLHPEPVADLTLQALDNTHGSEDRHGRASGAG
ncbi:MAG: hypothetical protein LBE30_08210 [Comamonas sp.]|jgi:hypothetical protein|nr:hypothetical protein [Comamonas sp.]